MPAVASAPYAPGSPPEDVAVRQQRLAIWPPADLTPTPRTSKSASACIINLRTKWPANEYPAIREQNRHVLLVTGRRHVASSRERAGSRIIKLRPDEKHAWAQITARSVPAGDQDPTAGEQGAIWKERAESILLVGVKVPVEGSYSSALLRRYCRSQFRRLSGPCRRGGAWRCGTDGLQSCSA